MKKIYSLLLASALVFTSCSDFLDTKPQGKLTQDIFFGEEEGALMGINAIYSQMKSWDLIGFSWFGIMRCRVTILIQEVHRQMVVMLA